VPAVDGVKVHNSADLVAKLYTFQPGQTVQMTILRAGQESIVPVILQKLDEAFLNKADKGESNDGNGPSVQGENDNLGLTYQDQTPEIKGQLPANAPRGPVVTQVDQQSPAAQAGLQPGDIIRKVGNTDIVSANQLTVVLKKSDLKTGVRLFVWRDGVTLYSFLQTGDE
jgi:serine protease Do